MCAKKNSTTIYCVFFKFFYGFVAIATVVFYKSVIYYYCIIKMGIKKRKNYENYQKKWR